MPNQEKEIGLGESLLRLAYDLLYNNDITSLQAWLHNKHGKPLFHESLDDYLEEELVLELYIHRLQNEEGFKKKLEYDMVDIQALDEAWLQQMMGEGYYTPPNPQVTPEKIIEDIEKTKGEIRWPKKT